MSWATELCAVYEKASDPKFEGKYGTTPLPISHSTANAQVEVVIDGGNVDGAKAIESDENSVTVIPVTEDSGARSSGICPHPFADKLIYLAGDYAKYCPTKKGDEDKYRQYIEQLKRWRDSEYTHPSVNLLYEYLSKGTLISDLVRARVFTVDDSGRLSSDKILKTAQSDVFIRFVIIDSDVENTWEDKTLQDAFIKYNASVLSEKNFSYADGKMDYCTYKHPSKILNAGDKGKLFSANDDTGFSYRGRFENKEQAFSIGYEFSQKMHNGLKWLIENPQVKRDREQKDDSIVKKLDLGITLVAWDSELQKLPNFCGDSENLSDDETAEYSYPDYFNNYMNLLEKSIFGSKYKEILDGQRVMVMALDEATTGRVSVNLYSEMSESEFRNNIQKWHKDTAWNRYSYVKDKNYIGSFSLKQIVNYAYGTEKVGKNDRNAENNSKTRVECDKKLMKAAILRLIPCVTEGRKLPGDIVQQLANRTSRRNSYKKAWNSLLEVTCGMIRKKSIDEGEEYSMALDNNRHTRSYLYGRLLAVAETAEKSTYEKGQERATNAEAYFERFSNSPASTWAAINNRLTPYFKRMNTGAKTYYQKIIDEIMDKFDVDEFNDNSKLDPEFLLAYSCQRKEFYTKKENETAQEE